MKQHLKILFSTTLFLSSAVSFSQVQGAYLDINNVKARFEFNKPIFNHNQTGSHGFVTQKNGQSHGIYSSGIWIGGKDVNGQLHLAGQVYGTGNDFVGAPSGDYDAIYPMTSLMVDDFIANWQSTSYVVPQEILDWPAHGNIASGDPYYLAPFFDNNSDGIYNPADGDYPKIKGNQAIYWYLTDSCVHTETNGDMLNIGMHCMAYAYDCPLDSALNNTVFIDYRINNKSSNLYNDVWVGSFTDFDIGCSADDYVGCSVEKGVYYAYNGDQTDNASCNGSTPFSQSLPAVGSMMFGTNQLNDGQDNVGPNASNNYNVPYATAMADNGVCYKGLGHHYGDGIIDNERINLRRFGMFDRLGVSWANDPSNPLDYYAYLTGFWLDGTQWLYGGYGHFSDTNATSIPTDFMFPDTSDYQYWSTGGTPVSAWSEETESNLQGDRRTLGSTGPFRLTPGGEINITMAFIAAHDYTSSNNRAGIPILLDRAGDVSDFIEYNNLPVCGTTVGIKEEIDFGLNVYPNPGNGLLTIESQTDFTEVQVYNAIGELVYQNNNLLNSVEINLRAFADGVYVIKVSDDHGHSNQMRYIKQ